MATSRPGKAVSPQAAAFDRNEVQEETSPPPALSPHPLSLPLTNGETRSPVTQPGDRRPPHAVLARGDALCTSRRAERLGLGGGGRVKATRGPPADSLALTRSGLASAGLVSWCRGWRSGGDPVLPQKRAHFGRRVWPAGRAFRRPRRCGHRRMRVREPCGKARQDRTHRGAERVVGSAVSASAWGAAAGSSRLARAFLSKGVRGAVSSAGPPCTPRPTKCFGRAAR